MKTAAIFYLLIITTVLAAALMHTRDELHALEFRSDVHTGQLGQASSQRHDQIQNLTERVEVLEKGVAK